MRIIGGTHKGRSIHLPAHFNARPTTDIAKEGLFNILNNYFEFENLDVLDLFAGTGSISFEFASRHANMIHAIEQNGKLFSFIKKNVTRLGFTRITPFKTDVFRYIRKCENKFNIIFADPPYQLKTLDQIPQCIVENNLLKKGGWLILEHPKDYHFEGTSSFFKTKKYGSVHFSFFVNNE